MRIAYCDLEQAESRTVGAIIYRLFGDDTYLNVQECVTGEHEVLTPLGWVPIANQPNQIACWSPTDQTINFMEVIKWHTHTADTTLSIEGRNFNIRCTPQHKMPYWSSRKPQRIQHEPAEKLVQRYSRRLPLTGFYKQGSASISPEYAKFCAAFQADGYINKNKQIEFSFNKQRKIERMHKILNQLDFQYNINTFSAYREGELPQTRFYVKCPVEDIPPKVAGLYLLEWKLPSLISYIEEHEFWDGHRENASGYRMVSVNYKHLEWIATIAHLCGYAATINTHKQDYYILTIRSWNTAVTEKTAYKMETHKESIQVYCPTVPSGFFIFRYKGQIAVTGNSGDPHSLVCSMAWRNLPWPADFRLELLPSMPNRKFPPDLMAAARAVANTEYYRGKSYRDMAKTLSHGSNYYGQPATMAKHTHTEVKIIATFQTGYFGAFPSIRRWHNWVKLQLETTATITTLLGRKRKFWGRPDDNATLREMIAFEPQSVATGDYMNAGMLALWQQNLPLYLHKQIHDALAFSFDRRDEEWLIPAVCETLSWPITLTAHPDQLTTLQKLVRRSQQEERDLAKLLALPQREFRIPVEANVGWNLSKASPKNPNGLIKWKSSVPDTRSRTSTVALTPMERIRLGLCDFTGIV